MFRWLFIPWLQAELDAYTYRVNHSAKRADKNKVLPHGVPTHIHHHAEDYNCVDFKVSVNPRYLLLNLNDIPWQVEVRPEHVDTVEEIYAPSDHPVFQLVPDSFAEYAARFYATLGSPAITRGNVWDVYRTLLASFHALEAAEHEAHDEEWNNSFTLGRDDQWDAMQLMDGQPLVERENTPGTENTPVYQGGVNGGAGLGE